MKLFGLIGYPLTHSFSKSYFTNKFQNEGIDAQYDNFELNNIDLFNKLLSEKFELQGLNVTIPYKEKIIPYLSDLDPVAKQIGAVNVIRFVRSQDSLKLIGYNSDALGFSDSIKPLLSDFHRKALILGTGGASKAIEYSLNSFGIETRYVSRNSEKRHLTYADLNEHVINEYLLIVNTTPLGMYPNIDTYPDIPYQYLTANHLLYDLHYNPAQTKFMEKGLQKGATVKNGMDMLMLQANAAWDIWNL